MCVARPLNCHNWGVRKTITTKCACFLSFIFLSGKMEGEEMKRTILQLKAKDKMREEEKRRGWPNET